MARDVAIEVVRAAAYRIPTEDPVESDGTIAWDSTTLILANVTAGGCEGLGYSYGDATAASLIERVLAAVIRGHDALAIIACWADMRAALRNIGRPGIGSMAISAVDAALWDLKAKIFDMPLVALLGRARAAVPVYGSGGFTSYSRERLAAQLSGWADEGMSMVKMKVGREPEADLERVMQARAAIGNDVALFVDANGGYTRKEALEKAVRFAPLGVAWFEEPVSSDDLDGLRLLRDRAPAGIDIAAGEYGHDEVYFRRMLTAGAVDVLQADATRCGGVTGFQRAASLCSAFQVPLSAHCAPSLHAALGCALPEVVHLEYFHDHVRIEHLLFEGAPRPVHGGLAPGDGPGLGLVFKAADAERFRI